MNAARHQLYCGDALTVLRDMPADTFDCCVTDPPYELTSIVKRFGKPNSAPVHCGPYERSAKGFMGLTWDGSGIQRNPELWGAISTTLKPGAHLLAFGGTRTYHRMVCAIEDAGFEIRDTICWHYGQGFPKSLNVAKAIDKAAGAKHARSGRSWTGWGTALKPATELIVLARKPLSEPSVAANVLRWGTGAINIDSCRIGARSSARKDPRNGILTKAHMDMRPWMLKRIEEGLPLKADFDGKQGRWPANVILDEAAAEEMDRQSGHTERGAHPAVRNGSHFGGGKHMERGERIELDGGGASRFFYVAKASRAERNAGCEDLPEKPLRWSASDQNPGSFQSQGTHKAARNAHPTVKPIALMSYLVRLACPPGGIVLDPFMGSGTTGIACMVEGFRFAGIENKPEYVELASRRIAHALAK